MHKKLEKLDGVLRSRDDLVRRIQDINAVILQRGAGEGNIEGYRVSGARICQPFTLNFTQIASQPRSAEQLFREHLESIDPAFVPGELEEHLWLVSRWFYSNPREGEIFFREKDWPYRKILRACARLLQPGEESAGDDSKANGKATASDGSAKQT
jgi:hypothetical protein